MSVLERLRGRRRTAPGGGRELVVVTGASGGIGRATARAFAARGATVVLIARGREGLRAAAEDVEKAGGRPVVIPLDVSDADAVETAVADIESDVGPIDV